MHCYHELLRHTNHTTDTGLTGLTPDDYNPYLKGENKVVELAPDLTNCGLCHIQETLVLNPRMKVEFLQPIGAAMERVDMTNKLVTPLI